MPNFYGYSRISHKDQEKGDSVAGQKQRGQQYWAAHFKETGVEWGGFFEEPGHISGRSTPFMRRKAGKEACATLKAGDFLYVDKVDRLWRDIHDFSDLMRWFKNQQVTVVFGNLMGGSFTTDTPLGDFMLGLLVLIGQLESDQISDRILGTFSHQRQNGFFPHPAACAPMGTKAVKAVPAALTVTNKPKKMLVWDIDMRLIMSEIVRRHDVQNQSFAEISDEIEAKTQKYMPRFRDSRRFTDVNCAYAYLLEKQYALIIEPRFLDYKALPRRSDAVRLNNESRAKLKIA